MILSILIPVLPDRYPEFMRLLHELQRQVSNLHNNHSSLGLVEILFDDRPHYLEGGPTIGSKRNALRQKALGKYQCQVDSDDWIAPNFIETIVRLAQEDMDIISWRCLFKNNHYWSVLNMSLSNKENEQASPAKVIERTVWHVCAIKTEIARKGNYDDAKNHGEDWSFMEMIMEHLHTESHSNIILTQYNHSEENSEADKILQAGHK